MKVILQSSIRGLSGGIEDWVYQIRDGKTYVGPKPKRTKEPSPAELQQRERFKEATVHAKSALADPVSRAFYEAVAEERGINAYALAVADFLNLPDFKPLNLSDYKGRVGDPIIIRADDDLGFASVDISISAQDGTTIEQGSAVELGARSGKWTYIATTPVALGSDVFIEVKGVDHAGNAVGLTENPRVGIDD